MLKTFMRKALALIYLAIFSWKCPKYIVMSYEEFLKTLLEVMILVTLLVYCCEFM